MMKSTLLGLLASLVPILSLDLGILSHNQLMHHALQPRSWLGSTQIWYRNGDQPFWVEEFTHGDWHETWYEEHVDRARQTVHLVDHTRRLNCIIEPHQVTVRRWGEDEPITQEEGRWGEVSYVTHNSRIHSTNRLDWFLTRGGKTTPLTLLPSDEADILLFDDDAGTRVILSKTFVKFGSANPDRGRWEDEKYLEEHIRPVEPVLVINPGQEIGIVTINTPNIHNWAVYAERNQIHYAKLHGYTIYIYRNSFLPRRIVHWGKILATRRHLPDHKHLFWIDSDAIVTDMDKKIEDVIAKAPTKHFYACGDIGGWMLNTGVLIFHNHPWTMKMLEDLWAKEHIGHDRGAEQSTLIRLLSNEDPKQENWHLFPECEFNCHPRHHREGHYVMHMMGDSGDNRKREFVKWNKRFGVDMDGLHVPHNEL